MLELCFLFAAITIFPFSWNSHSFNKVPVTVTKSIWLRWVRFINAGLTGAHAVFVIVRLIPGFGYTQHDFQTLHYSVLLQVLMAIAFSTTAIMQLQTVLDPSDLVTVLNQLLHFNKTQGK